MADDATTGSTGTGSTGAGSTGETGEKRSNARKVREGIAVSTKMDKTAVITVIRRVRDRRQRLRDPVRPRVQHQAVVRSGAEPRSQPSTIRAPRCLTIGR